MGDGMQILSINFPFCSPKLFPVFRVLPGIGCVCVCEDADGWVGKWFAIYLHNYAQERKEGSDRLAEPNGR